MKKKDLGAEPRVTVVGIGVQPPPVTGASLATARMFDSIAEQHELRRIGFNVKPGASKLSKTRSRLASMVETVFAVARRGASVLYVSLPGGASAMALIPVLFISRVKGNDTYLHHHNFTYVNRFSPLYKAVFMISGRRCNHLVLCPAMESGLRSLYKVANFTELSNLAFISQPAAFDRAPSEDDDLVGESVFVVAHMSNLSEAKGLSTVLGVFRSLKLRVPNAQLRLGGPAAGPKERLAIETFAQSCPGVEWRGFVEQSELGDFYSGVDVFLLPSGLEAQPLVVLEALSYGVPSITFGVGCLPDTPHVQTVVNDDEMVATLVARSGQSTATGTIIEETRASIDSWQQQLIRIVADMG